MSKIIIELNKKTLVIIFLVVLLAGLFFFQKNEVKANPLEEKYNSLNSPTAKKLFYDQSEKLTKEVPERLIELDEKTIGCFGPSSIMQMGNDADNLGGQCCGTLKNIKSYDIQIKVLSDFIEENGNIEVIPRDPYDMSIEHAKQLTSFDKDIVLSAEQENVYNEAISMSHHGGPCCCKCWKWYVMSGLAKKLIVDYNWNEHQIAELWDLSSSCGHDEDTNMVQHYDSKEEHSH